MRKSKALYPDHIFGDIEKPPKSLKYHAQRVLGIHHWDQVIKSSSGNEEMLTIAATSHSNLAVRSLFLRWTEDDWQSSQEMPFEAIKQTWDNLTWAWLRYWQISLPIAQDTILRYQIYALLSDGRIIFADNQANEPDEATQFARWLSKQHHPPQWAKDARVYQIFVDRFSPGEGKDWLQTEDLRQPFGGTIRGVIEKIDYIQQLGFNTLWLSPIFRSPSHHGYDVSDYFQIEPRFGTEADLSELIQGLHQRGMRIILDFVANHCSSQHAGFLAAQESKEDPYYGWFKWKRWPKKYDCFYNVPGMPQLNLRFGKPARQHLLEAARKWLTLGVDGYRLDYANGPDRDFWVDFQRVCLEINPQCWTFGEIVAPLAEQNQYAGSMHGTLDFLSCQMIRETFATRQRSVANLAAYLETSQKALPPGFSRPAFIDNHDMNRFFFTAEGNRRALHAALTLLYLLPQAPILYYGTEIELSQERSIHDRGSSGFDEARLAMRFEDPSLEQANSSQTSSTSHLIRELSNFRSQNPWLTEAEWKLIETSEDGHTARLELKQNNHRLKFTISEGENGFSVSFQ